MGGGGAQVLGNITPEVATGARARLAAALAADGVRVHEDDEAGGFRVAQYGPMYSLKPRKNEIILRVTLG